jgi:hypothetical protein
MPPIGRARYPTANVVKADISDTMGSLLGKNACPIGRAKIPNSMKS